MPIPVKDLDPPLNGQSTYAHLETNGSVYVASLAKFASLDKNGKERVPTLQEWKTVLKNGNLVTTRDRPPTPPGIKLIIYGRVAGVSNYQAHGNYGIQYSLTFPLYNSTLES